MFVKLTNLGVFVGDIYIQYAHILFMQRDPAETLIYFADGRVTRCVLETPEEILALIEASKTGAYPYEQQIETPLTHGFPF